MTTANIDQSELDNLSDEEREALEGEDVGTEGDAERAAKAAEGIPDDDADAAAAAAAEATADGEKSGDDTPAAADPTDDGLRLAPPSIDGHEQQLNALLDQRKGIREQYRNGDITAEDKDRLEDELDEKISDLRADIKNAAFVENFNAQAAEREHVKAIKQVKAEILERDGINYDEDQALWQRWDFKVRALAADPANAHRSSRWFLEEAHKAVLKEEDDRALRRGFRRDDPKPPSDPVRDAVRNRRPPETRAKSLAALPAAAADTGHANSEFAGLDALEGDDLEAAVARMTPEQQERWARA